jgi:hypothetical protein
MTPLPQRLLARSKMLDTVRAALYKPRRFWAVGLAAWASVAGAEVINGVQFPDGTTKVGENRFRAPENLEETLKYYKLVYPTGSYPRRSIVNQPGVKAVHISNPSGKNFEGLNIYEANDEVRIYVVTAEAAKPKRSPAPTKQPAKKK